MMISSFPRLTSAISRFRLGSPFKRFLKVNVADLRKGDWIELEDGKMVVVSNLASSHSGRGSRSFLLTVKDPIYDSVTTIKPTGRDTFERLELRDVSCKYLYSTDTEINLMDDKTFEELTIPKSIVKPEIYNLLEDGLSLKMRFAQDKPVGLVLPRIIKCTVAEVLDSAEGTDKKLCVVKLAGGARLNCSVNLQPGDVVNVDTEELTYQGRLKQAQA